MQALFTLTSSESKRLIAKAVAAMPEVQEAVSEGYLIIGRGSTNAYIAEELLDRSIEKEKYVAGQIIRGVPCALMQGVRLQSVVFHRGKVLDAEPSSLLGKLGRGDILLKGANAIDHSGTIGVFMASPLGGTMGEFYLPMKARGSMVIYPVGLEKMIPSVEEAARMGGILAFERSIGVPVGMVCVADGIPYTELDALEELFGVEAVHFASGGYGGSEGCVTIAIEGDDVDVNDCVDFIEEKIKGEPPLAAVKTPCSSCPVLCSFQGKEEADLPPYLRGE